MARRTWFTIAALAVLAWPPASLAEGHEATTVNAASQAANPLLAPWSGPLGGVPPFDAARVELFQPALEAAMTEALAQVDAIANNPEPASFDNVIAALERSGRTLGRVIAVYNLYGNNLSTPEFQAVEREMEPRLAAYRDRINQNEALFRRVAAVYESPDKASLTPEQQRLTWLRYTNMVRAGARLAPAGKQEVAAINQRLASLFTAFSQNVLADEEHNFLVIDDESSLAGLPASFVSSAAAAARRLGHEGKWAVLNTRSAVAPFLTFAERRDLRERVWRTFANRGDESDTHDTNAIAAEILALRARRAELLGYPTHAHWRLENAMARNPDRAMEMMEAVWPPAVARVAEEVTDMQALADAEGAGITIEPWDYRYFAEKVRKARYDLDEQALKPYLQMDRLLEGAFWVVGELYGLRFEALEAGAVPVFHPDVRVWAVRRADGSPVGLFYHDPYARAGKRSGAWATAYRVQERVDGTVLPIISNNCNFMQGANGQPTLLSWDDAKTLFHEFGHAVQGLLSDVTYASLAGTGVARDAVEHSSQLMEHWLSTHEVLDRFARHYQTGAPMPDELVARIHEAENFNQGFETVEYLADALLDMQLHLAGAKPIDIDAFEREALAGLGMPKEIILRHRLPQFQHIFGSDGYSAGYYSYMWADQLVADTWEAFQEAGGAYDREVAGRLRDKVLSVGNSVDPIEGYRAFRGRDATVDALLRKRGFPVPAKGGDDKTSSH